MLTPKEQKIIQLMRQFRSTIKRTGAYDVILFGNNEDKQKQMLSELRWQILNGPGEALTETFGEAAVIKLTLLRIPQTV